MKYANLIKEIEVYVKKISKRNFIYDDIFKNHINLVRNFALQLAKIYKADKEVIEVAALLHDIHYIKHKKQHNKHEIQGAKIAVRMLKDKLPKEKIELIAKCIKHHRGAKNYKRESIEEQIVACADAMAHISGCLRFIYLSGTVKFGLETSEKWLKGKMQRGWKKITLPKARKIIEDKYKAIMTLLENEIKKS